MTSPTAVASKKTSSKKSTAEPVAKSGKAGAGVAPAPAKKKAAASKAAVPAKQTKAVVAAAPAAKKAARKTAAVKTVKPEERHHLIEVAAYYIAERRGFLPGSYHDDWLQAEQEIDRLLAAGKFRG